MESIRIGIIGTAGRREDRQRLSKSAYVKMMEEARWMIESVRGSREVYLVSGGAAWADHVAVNLYQEGLVKGLYLCLPCEWDFNNSEFKDTGEVNWKTNPGGTSNYYHMQFREDTGVRSLLDLDTVLRNGAKKLIGNGYHDRNSVVAKADYMLAMTFGKGRLLKDGGTADTMKKFLSTHDETCGYHLDLTDFSIYQCPIVH